METTTSPAQDSPSNSGNVPVSQVLALALLCGALTFGCLFTSVRASMSSSSPAKSATGAVLTDSVVPAGTLAQQP